MAALLCVVLLLQSVVGALAMPPSARAVYDARVLATLLLKDDVPLIFVQVVVLVCLAGYLENAGWPGFDTVEYFAGRMAITLSLRWAGLRAYGCNVVLSLSCIGLIVFTVCAHSIVFTVFIYCPN